MPDEIPPLTLGLGPQNERLVLLGDRGDATEMAGLLRLAPELASDAHAIDLARAVNHFAHEAQYRVIDDPKRYADDYRAQIEREDPAAEWQEGVVRLRDFGVPDFSQIEVPKLAGGKLTFYAVDAYLGVPYKVEMENLEAAPEYTAMPLTPLPRPPRPPAKAQTTKGGQGNRGTVKATPPKDQGPVPSPRPAN